jgi:hypothetical protein
VKPSDGVADMVAVIVRVIVGVRLRCEAWFGRDAAEGRRERRAGTGVVVVVLHAPPARAARSTPSRATHHLLGDADSSSSRQPVLVADGVRGLERDAERDLDTLGAGVLDLEPERVDHGVRVTLAVGELDRVADGVGAGDCGGQRAGGAAVWPVVRARCACERAARTQHGSAAAAAPPPRRAAALALPSPTGPQRARALGAPRRPAPRRPPSATRQGGHAFAARRWEGAPPGAALPRACGL